MKHQDFFYPESRFGGFSDIDGTMAFYSRVNAILKPSFRVLDVGCGRGAHCEDPVEIRRNLRNLRGKVASVVGLDVDENARDNPTIDEFHLLNGDTWPIPDDTFDLIVCDDVLEHVERPDSFFAEVRRTLRNGGYLCIRTPNRWSYVALLATIIPSKYHARVTRTSGCRRKEEDFFPTLYRCNSTRKLRKALKNHGFEGVVYGYEAEPGYLSFSKLTYRLGVWHQRFAPSFMRLSIFVFAKCVKETAGS